MTAALKQEIKKLARESVHEALKEEILRGRAVALPFVSAKEQRIIENLYGRPSRRGVRTLQVRV